MKSNVEEIIEEGIQKYRLKPKIVGRKYDLYIFSEDEDLNLFEGFLYSRIESKDELSYLINKYKPGGGYAARLCLLIYRNQLIIKDYRQDKLIRKTLEKVNETFIKKLKGAIAEPNKDNLNKLFDRTDIIEEFYLLYRKSREYLLKNLRGISEEEKRIEFIDNLMMQLLTLWYLQEKGFFNKDTSYFITKFKELKQSKLLKEFDSFYKFLLYLFNKISNRVNSQYYEDHIVGKVVVAGPAIFLNGEYNSEAISIPDKCFYVEGKTEYLIEANPKKISEDVPLLNLLESRDWTEGNIDEFVLGAIYEKLITYDERKKLGAYYTPEEITSYICKNAIVPYLVDRINRKFGENFETIDSVIESERKDILIYLFEQLKEIKICDLAVGSAHFLESAINVLVDIYKKLWNKAKEIGLKKGLDILVTNENGNIEKINLVSLSDEEQFKLYIKFFIILSRNIYGVDINPSALKIAKARLFLTLAKHFDVNKNYFIRFPNVHFNLRDGNSLIGYVEISKRKGEIKQLKLDLQLSDNETEYIAEKIKELPEDLAKYLQNTAEVLNIDGDIQTEIKELNRILSKKKIEWDDFEKVLKTKEKLIQILIVSLNSQYAMPLNYLLNKITELFNHKLDEKFAKEHNIDLNELREIKTFHWIFEFPEVFLRENPGFDVVIGNPPYVRQENIDNIVEEVDYKGVLSKLYDPFNSVFDFSIFFILRSIQITNKKGYHSFIITNKWLRAEYGQKIRKFLKENFNIKKVIDFGKTKVFMGATVDAMIYVIQKQKPNMENKILYSSPSRIDEIEENIIFVDQNRLNNEGWTFSDEKVLALREKIEEIGKPLKEWGVKIYRGILTGLNEAFIITTEKRDEILSNCKTEEERKRTEEIMKPILRGRDIKRYYYKWAGLWVIGTFPALHININDYPALKAYLQDFGNKLNQDGKPGHRKKTSNKWFETQDSIAYYSEFEKEKIVWQRVAQEPKFTIAPSGLFCEATTHFITGPNLKYLLAIFNSKMFKFAFYKFYMGGGIEGEIKGNFIGRFPVPPITSQNQHMAKELGDLVNKILTLTKDSDHLENPDKQERIKKYERQIDQIVYRLYGLTEDEIPIIEEANR